jgi:hypothetical protein
VGTSPSKLPPATFRSASAALARSRFIVQLFCLSSFFGRLTMAGLLCWTDWLYRTNWLFSIFASDRAYQRIVVSKPAPADKN